MTKIQFADDATELFNDLESRRSNTSPILLFTSDDWDPFKTGLLNVYGSLEQPPCCGIGRKPLPILMPPEDLKYAQVCKKIANGHVVEVLQRVVFGDVDEVLRLFSNSIFHDLTLSDSTHLYKNAIVV
jgi:hypothetical protein